MTSLADIPEGAALIVGSVSGSRVGREVAVEVEVTAGVGVSEYWRVGVSVRVGGLVRLGNRVRVEVGEFPDVLEAG